MLSINYFEDGYQLECWEVEFVGGNRSSSLREQSAESSSREIDNSFSPGLQSTTVLIPREVDPCRRPVK